MRDTDLTTLQSMVDVFRLAESGIQILNNTLIKLDLKLENAKRFDELITVMATELDIEQIPWNHGSLNINEFISIYKKGLQSTASEMKK